jgi:deoxyadenosine/deoxycytidine kinase
MSLAKYRFIAVEGPIGAGKTTLARRLAERLGGAPLLEDPDANPFLERFYEDMARYALPTQLFFLFQRFEQLRAVAQPDLFATVRVADFLLEKDPLFASLTLAGDELSLYQRLYDALSPRAPRPDLVIYLQAGPRTLAERVRRRALEYERRIEEDYLARLADAYARFFHQYDDAPVLAVNSEHLDFAASGRDLALLVDHVAAMRGRRAYFNVGE